MQNKSINHVSPDIFKCLNTFQVGSSQAEMQNT